MALIRAIGQSGGNGGTWGHVATVYNTTDSGTTLNISDLMIGKTYHLFVTNAGSGTGNSKNNAALTAGTGVSDFTDLGDVNGCALGSTNYYSSLRHYSFIATSTSITLGKVNQRYIGYMLYVETVEGSSTGSISAISGSTDQLSFTISGLEVGRKYILTFTTQGAASTQAQSKATINSISNATYDELVAPSYTGTTSGYSAYLIVPIETSVTITRGTRTATADAYMLIAT